MQPGQKPQGNGAPPGHPSQGHGAPPGHFPSNGYPPPRRGLPGWGIALIVVGSVILVLGLLVAISFPAFQRYRQKAKTTEAPENIKRIFDGAKTYYESGGRGVGVDRTGTVTSRFPDSVELTPELPCCKGQGGRCPQTDWDHPTWKALGFAVAEPHYFQYRFESQLWGKDATFTAGAHADLDCNGVFSTFERTGRVDENDLVVGSSEMLIEKEFE